MLLVGTTASARRRSWRSPYSARANRFFARSVHSGGGLRPPAIAASVPARRNFDASRAATRERVVPIHGLDWRAGRRGARTALRPRGRRRRPSRGSRPAASPALLPRRARPLRDVASPRLYSKRRWRWRVPRPGQAAAGRAFALMLANETHAPCPAGRCARGRPDRVRRATRSRSTRSRVLPRRRSRAAAPASSSRRDEGGRPVRRHERRRARSTTATRAGRRPTGCRCRCSAT